MSFQSTSRNIRLQNPRVPTLLAECQDYNKKWKPSQLDLNLHIGNSNGNFVLGGSNFSLSSGPMVLTGATLQATLAGNNNSGRTNTLNLNICVANINGSLKFQKPSESLLNSGCCYSLDGSFLRGICMAFDGLFYASTFDLNRFYGNTDGKFCTGRPECVGFSFSSRNASIQAIGESIVLQAELQDSRGNWVQSSIDLATSVIIQNGNFSYRLSGPFDKDGFFARFFERIPFVGFIVAGLQAWANNNDRATRALAYCANSTIVCVGAIVGALIGGPFGGAVGAGLTTWIGVLVETQIAGKVNDPTIFSEFEGATIGRVIYETARNTLATAAAGYFAQYIGKLVESNLLTAGVLEGVASAFGTVVQKPSSTAAEFFLKKLSDTITNQVLPAEWTQAEDQVKRLSPETVMPKEYY